MGAWMGRQDTRQRRGHRPSGARPPPASLMGALWSAAEATCPGSHRRPLGPRQTSWCSVGGLRVGEAEKGGVLLPAPPRSGEASALHPLAPPQAEMPPPQGAQAFLLWKPFALGPKRPSFSVCPRSGCWWHLPSSAPPYHPVSPEQRQGNALENLASAAGQALRNTPCEPLRTLGWRCPCHLQLRN